MTLEEAIKRLSTLPLASRDFEIGDDKKALGLGIEASKEVIADRISGILPSNHLLPGETEK